MIGCLAPHFPQQTLANSDILRVHCPRLLLNARVVEVLVGVEVDVDHVHKRVFSILA